VVRPAAHCHTGQLRQLHDPREFFSSPDVSSSVWGGLNAFYFLSYSIQQKSSLSLQWTFLKILVILGWRWMMNRSICTTDKSHYFSSHIPSNVHGIHWWMSLHLQRSAASSMCISLRLSLGMVMAIPTSPQSASPPPLPPSSPLSRIHREGKCSDYFQMLGITCR
jgi:hypothetical protein